LTLRGFPLIASFISVGWHAPRGVETTPEREQEVERLYRDVGARLWRAVMAYCGDREITNDAVAEAFAQVLARGEAVHAPLPWLWRSAFRIAAGELKARARTVPPGDDAARLRGLGPIGKSKSGLDLVKCRAQSAEDQDKPNPMRTTIQPITARYDRSSTPPSVAA
jgi:DNA-directed RNA polymerase specialized sigma24 family protein